MKVALVYWLRQRVWKQVPRLNSGRHKRGAAVMNGWPTSRDTPVASWSFHDNYVQRSPPWSKSRLSVGPLTFESWWAHWKLGGHNKLLYVNTNVQIKRLTVSFNFIWLKMLSKFIRILRIRFCYAQLCGRCLVNMTPVVKLVIHCVFALL